MACFVVVCIVIFLLRGLETEVGLFTGRKSGCLQFSVGIYSLVQGIS